MIGARRLEAAIRHLAAIKATTAVDADQAKAWVDIEVLIEAGRSGKNMKRPLLERLRRDVKAGRVSHVVCLRVDRISRSTLDLLNLLKEFKSNDVGFVSVVEGVDTTTSLGEFTLTLLGAVAQLERSTIAERTTLALKTKRQKGEVYSRVPFGWKQDGNRLVPVAGEQEALSAARKMRDNRASFQEIADFFTKKGIKPHGGGRWYPASARQVLRSKMAQEVA